MTLRKHACAMLPEAIALWSMLSNICSTGNPKAFSMAALLASHLCTGALSCSSDSTRQKSCRHTHTQRACHISACMIGMQGFPASAVQHLQCLIPCCAHTHARTHAHTQGVSCVCRFGMRGFPTPVKQQLQCLPVRLACHMCTGALSCKSDSTWQESHRCRPCLTESCACAVQCFRMSATYGNQRCLHCSGHSSAAANDRMQRVRQV